jgi:hypothetical protein
MRDIVATMEGFGWKKKEDLADGWMVYEKSEHNYYVLINDVTKEMRQYTKGVLFDLTKPPDGGSGFSRKSMHGAD